MKKIYFCFILSVLSTSTLVFAVGRNQAPIWSHNVECQQPESAYYDPRTQVIYVSNIVGEADKKDGQGWIQKLNINGKVINAKWITGLNAPKGIRVHDNSLWVSDIDQMVEVDIAQGAVKNKITIPGAKFLNDVATDEAGVVYVSDTVVNKIFKIENHQVSVFAEGDLEGPNGVLVSGDDLIVAGWGNPEPDFSTKVPGHLYKLNLKTKKKTLITPKPLGNLDGLEQDENGDYLVSDWKAGIVYRVSKGGKAVRLFDGMKGSADIGYIPELKRLIIPIMLESRVITYDLK